MPLFLVIALVLTVVPAVASAQVIEGLPRPEPATPPRVPARGASDANLPTQALNVSVNLTGGYDNNSLPLEQLPSAELLEQQGLVTTAAAGVTYRRGTLTRYIDAYARGYSNRGDTTVGQPTGGNAGLNFATPITRRMGMTLGVGTSYVPTSLADAFGGLSHQIDTGVVPDTNPTQALTASRWFAVDGSVAVHRNWTSRQRMEFQYAAVRREILEGPEGSTTNRQTTMSLLHSWDFRQSAGVEFSYRLDQHEQDRLVDARPFQMHVADARVRLARRLAPTRQLAFMFGGGVTHVQTPLLREGAFGPADPTVFASARLDLLRRLAVAVDARRDVTVLDGITPQPFVTNAASVRLEGAVSRVQYAVSYATSRGDSDTTELPAFDTTTATAQAQYSFSRSIAIFATFMHYEHRLQDLTPVLVGLPSQYNRDSIRVGLSLWMPLLGRS